MLISDEQFKAVAKQLENSVGHYIAEVHNETGQKVLYFDETETDIVSRLDDVCTSKQIPLWLMIKKLVLRDERTFSVQTVLNKSRNDLIAMIDNIADYETRHHVIDEDVFFERFKPQLNHILGEEDIHAYETYGDDLQYVLEVANKQPHRVWTVMDSEDSDSTIIVEGYHLINRISYLITEHSAHPDHTFEITH